MRWGRRKSSQHYNHGNRSPDLSLYIRYFFPYFGRRVSFNDTRVRNLRRAWWFHDISNRFSKQSKVCGMRNTVTTRMWDGSTYYYMRSVRFICHSCIGTIDKNQIMADLSTYGTLCGMMSKSTALVNSFFTWLWLWVHRDNKKTTNKCFWGPFNNKHYYMCA